MWTSRRIPLHHTAAIPLVGAAMTQAATTIRDGVARSVLLGTFMGAAVASAPAHAAPIVNVPSAADPDGWFELTGSVNYPIGTTTSVDFYAVYRIPTTTDAKGITTIDYSKSTITLIQKTGVSGWNGFTTLPIGITDVEFVSDTKGPISTITFSSALFDPQVPGGYSDKGISGTIDFATKTGTITDKYTNDTKMTNITHTTTISDITNTNFDTAALPPAVPRERLSFVVKDKIPAIPPPSPDTTIAEPSTAMLLTIAGALAIGATLLPTGARRQTDQSMKD